MFRNKSTKEMVRGGPPEAPGSRLDEKKRKKEKRSAEKPPKESRLPAFFRTKTFYGIVSIVLGLAVALGGVPLLRAQTVGTVDVVCFAADVGSGTLITEGLLTTVEAASYHMPSGALFDTAQAVGRYLTVDAIAGDYVTSARLSAQYPGDDPFLLNLPEGKVAISIPLPDLAQSVSGKLRAGDVVQIFAAENSGGSHIASAPAELRYVEVLTVTYQDGVDVGEGGHGAGSSAASNILSTATLLVNAKQAVTLAGLQKNASLYVALVIRGNDARKSAALAAQDAFFVRDEGDDNAGAGVVPEEIEPIEEVD